MGEAVQRQAEAPLLAVNDLHAWYGESHVLHGISFDVSRGQVISLTGRNGVGKSTTLRAIMGLIKKRTGSVVLEDAETIRLKSRDIARRGVGFVPEHRGIFASLSVHENLMLPPVVGKASLSRNEIFQLFPNLERRMSSQGTRLSGGEQQMLAIARVLRAGAPLVLLDEPTEGLAPVIIEQIGAMLRKLRERGYTIVLVEQNVQFAWSVTDCFHVIEHGRVVDSFQTAGAAGSDIGRLKRYLGV
ncbi:ABC transporter ATP-binding protein [Aquamicrobium sp. LC103]|uniref:ABC transporter ATP-binding protein n=1 Tax=Aquamicrobium sp. LC103 TaxID=1120658 RepID=UPI00063E7864|nr:ABC transporter ATP-binding protein [Aquamicrobium sp. LC103]TKT69784.1 ABC transporter ATP-binding protein [Aquamicrobium sp. LC103]